MISCANCALITQKLQQDVKEFRNSFLVLLQSCQEEYQSCLSDVAAVVQRAELSSEALRGERPLGPQPISFNSQHMLNDGNNKYCATHTTMRRPLP